MSTHQQEVDAVYKDCFAPIKAESSSSLILSQAGLAYAKIFDLNIKYGYVSGNSFDHALVYLMAGWINKNVKNSWIKEIGQESLAGKITNQILDYYNKNNRGNASPSNKETLTRIINNMGEKDIRLEFEELSKNPDRTAKELQRMSEMLGEN